MAHSTICSQASVMHLSCNSGWHCLSLSLLLEMHSLHLLQFHHTLHLALLSHNDCTHRSPLFSLSLSPSFCLQNPLEESMSAGIIAAPVGGSSYVGLKPNSSKFFPVKDSVAWTRKTVSNGSKTHCMKPWNPIDNKKFETLSYLPPLSDESIAKEIEYMLRKGWVPCLEFDKVGHVHRENSRMPGYYDGRYWTLWKLPMFGCNDSSQVLNEIHDCKKAYPNAYIRCLAFDIAQKIERVSSRHFQSQPQSINKPPTSTSHSSLIQI